MKQPIYLWAKDDRPREKLIQKGTQALSNAELIAILIGTGSTSESAVDLSKRILSENGGNLAKLGRLGVSNFVRYNGIGEAKAISIVAALELGRRKRQSDDSISEKIRCSKDAYHHFYSDLVDLNYEEFWVLLLNKANRVIGRHKVSSGGIDSTIVDCRKIFKAAIDQMASSIILGHNHPSGNLKPSIQDKKLTQKVKDGAQLLGLQVIDHLIVAGNSYFSFADKGLI
ncbi:DNA repair protein RadC [bacterium SCSIO 12741]|nr:DNA repair protein RadC [bacterium SCSIO 12741]